MTDLAVQIRITSILSRGKLGGAIISGLTLSDQRYVAVLDYRLVPDNSMIEKGQQWLITGTVQSKQLRTNGFVIEQQQIIARTAELVAPSGKNVIEWISQSPDCAGVGQVKAARLWNTFGEDLIDLIERGDINILSAVISEDSAALICHAFNKFKLSRSLLWLDRIGVPTRIGQKVVAHYKDRLGAALEANPYVLLSFETRWPVVDDLARSRLGIAEDDPRRLEAAVEEALYCGFGQGHTCLPEADLKRRVRTLLGTKHALELENPGLRWYFENGMYQVGGCRAIESYIAERLTTMIAGEQPEGQQSLFALSEADGDAIANALEAFEEDQGFKLAPEQSQAVLMSASADVSLILGGAGCGKTTVLKALYAGLRAVQPAVAIHQMALAGRAAQRMTEATGVASSTIASFLNSIDPGELQPGSVVVVDEMSMVDAFLVYRLLRALPKGVRLVLVGDPAQLPPIGPGLVLHALAGNSAIPQTELTTTKRQSAASGIPTVATAIREHRAPVFANYEGLGSGVSFVSCKEHELDAEIVRIYEELGGSGDDYTVQILSPTKERAGGARNLNIALHNHYRANAEPVYSYDIYGGHGTVDAATNERVLLRVGDLVLFTVNDYALELRNGSLGRVINAMPRDEVTSGDSDCCTIEWDDGRKLVLKAMHIPALTHAYGLTIHKSQGSQFERVIVPIRRKSPLLDQALIYTAVTRGVKQVVLVGDEQAAREAIMAPPSAARRHTMLTSMLNRQGSNAKEEHRLND